MHLGVSQWHCGASQLAEVRFGRNGNGLLNGRGKAVLGEEHRCTDLGRARELGLASFSSSIMMTRLITLGDRLG